MEINRKGKSVEIERMVFETDDEYYPRVNFIANNNPTISTLEELISLSKVWSNIVNKKTIYPAEVYHKVMAMAKNCEQY